MEHVLKHRTGGVRGEPNWVQVLNHPGLISKLKMDALSSIEWTYVDSIVEATIFESLRMAEYALTRFRLKNHIYATELRGIDKDVLRIQRPDTVDLL